MNFPCSKEGAIFFYGGDFGQVKTDLGECNLNVIGLDGKYSKIFVSSPGFCQPCMVALFSLEADCQKWKPLLFLGP